MAEFNTCANLINDAEKVKELEQMYKSSKDPFQDILDMQRKLQTTLANKLPDRNIEPAAIVTKGQLVDWMDRNFDAIMDEFRELKTSIGGMSNGEKGASSVWKAWKSNNVEMRSQRLDDMSDSDRLEMLFEMIDIMHFIGNMILATGMTSKDVYMLYMLKNLENARRYNSGY